MPGQFGRGENGIELGARQARERIEFQPRPVLFDNRKRRALAAVVALAAAHPAVESGKLGGKRGDFADFAAGVAVAERQIALGIAQGERARRRCYGAHIGEPETGGKRVAIGKRFFEQPLRVEKQYRQRPIDFGDEFQQDRRFGAERRHHRRPAGREADRGLDDVARARPRKLGLERGHVEPPRWRGYRYCLRVFGVYEHL